MKRLIACALSLAMTGSAWAGPAGQTTSSGAATTKTKRTTKKSSSTADLSQQLQQMKQAIDAQQQQIQQLRQEMQAKDASYQQAQQQAQQQLQQAQSAASEAQSKASSFESTANEQKASVDRLSTDVTDLKSNMTNAALSAQDEQKRVSAVEGLLGRFRFNGDVRVRGESFFQNYSACKNCLDRNRARIRVRFGFDGKLNEDFAVESLAGDIFQLGNASYRILRVERNTVRVQDAKGEAPTIPIWIRSVNSRPKSLRRSCTSRTKSRAVPSATSSGVSSVARTTTTLAPWAAAQPGLAWRRT